MAKLLDQNAAELAGTLVSISGAVKSFAEDEEFIDALVTSAKKHSKNKLHASLLFFGDMTPLILSERHLKDTITILAAIEGENPNKMLRRNGAQVLSDAKNAWNDQLKDFFLQLGISG